MDMNNVLEITKDVLSYWISSILRNGFYFIIIFMIALISVFCSNYPLFD
jgi:hypothetical protein